MKENYIAQLQPIVITIGKQKTLIYVTKLYSEFGEYFFRLNESFAFSFAFEEKAGDFKYENYSRLCYVMDNGDVYAKMIGLFITSDRIKDFLKIIKWNKMTLEEKSILYHLSKNNLIQFDQNYNYYNLKKHSLIAINGERCNSSKSKIKYSAVLLHELSHLLYDIDKEYFNFVNNTYKRVGIPYKKGVKHILKGYYEDHDRIEDEWAAYLIEKHISYEKINTLAKVDTNAILKKFKERFFCLYSNCNDNKAKTFKNFIKYLEVL